MSQTSGRLNSRGPADRRKQSLGCGGGGNLLMGKVKSQIEKKKSKHSKGRNPPLGPEAGDPSTKGIRQVLCPTAPVESWYGICSARGARAASYRKRPRTRHAVLYNLESEEKRGIVLLKKYGAFVVCVSVWGLFFAFPRILWCWVSFARAFLLGRLKE